MPFLFSSRSWEEPTFLEEFIMQTDVLLAALPSLSSTAGTLNAAAVLGFRGRLMHHYEGIGFPLKLAETV